MIRSLIIVGIILLSMSSCKEEHKSTTIEGDAVRTLNQVAAKLKSDLDKSTTNFNLIPRSLNQDGSLNATKSKSWTSGFLPGTLLMLHDHTGDKQYKEAALRWMETVEKEKFDSTTHDLGFKIYCSFGNAYRIDKNQDYKEVVLTAAETLSKRYNPQVGAIKSWDFNNDVWSYPVIIDNMMNLEIMFEASLLSGDQKYYDIAVDHANTTLKNHFRSDNSSYHVIDYDPSTGEIRNRHTHQGADHESAWSRGQAWGLYGFTLCYRYTKDKRYLERANRIADYIINHKRLPADGIPYWDYDAPNIPDEPRDVSASTVTAAALYELHKFDQSKAKEYLSHADKILASLEQEKYRTDAQYFILDKSVGSIPGDFEHSVPISYADYYFVEALTRKKSFNSMKK